jgi:hypothetical protein
LLFLNLLLQEVGSDWKHHEVKIMNLIVSVYFDEEEVYAKEQALSWVLSQILHLIYVIFILTFWVILEYLHPYFGKDHHLILI